MVRLNPPQKAMLNYISKLDDPKVAISNGEYWIYSDAKVSTRRINPNEEKTLNSLMVRGKIYLVWMKKRNKFRISLTI